MRSRLSLTETNTISPLPRSAQKNAREDDLPGEMSEVSIGEPVMLQEKSLSRFIHQINHFQYMIPDIGGAMHVMHSNIEESLILIAHSLNSFKNYEISYPCLPEQQKSSPWKMRTT